MLEVYRPNGPMPSAGACFVPSVGACFMPSAGLSPMPSAGALEYAERMSIQRRARVYALC